MAKITLNDITASRGAKALYNNNNATIENAIENTLSRDGTSPNSMSADIDMDGNDILNVNSLTINGVNIEDQASAAAVSAAAALVSENAAAVSETNAASSESNASASAISVADQKIIWQGTHMSQGYDVNDAVTLSGTSYICVLTHATTNTPPNVTYWDVLAQQGSAGAGTGDMLAANDLSDVDNIATSRSNLGISATNTPNVAAGNIVATDVQAAINELDTEKEPADATILKDADIGVNVQSYDNDIATQKATQAEAEAGTSTAKRTFTPERVKQAIVALGGGSTTIVTPVDSSGGTEASIDFTSIPSGATRVVVGLNGVSCNATYSLMLQIGDSGGMETSGYAGAVSQSTNSQSWSSGARVRYSTGGSTEVYGGAITLDLVDDSTNLWMISALISRTTATQKTWYSGGYKALSGELTQVRLTTTTGTPLFNAGTVCLSYTT